MPTYIALLRAVNVGGNTLKMERLRELMADAGLSNVRTYVQSGNALFETDRPRAECLRAIENCLAGAARLPIAVLLRTPKELVAAIAKNPWARQPGLDAARLHITFLAGAAPADAAKKVEPLRRGEDRFAVAGKEIYLYCPGGYGETKLTNNAIEKALALRATTRNWNTVNKLVELAAK